MTLWIVRICFCIFSAIVGWDFVPTVLKVGPVIGAAAGFVVGVIIIGIELGLKSFSFRGVAAAMIGFILGAVMSNLVIKILFNPDFGFTPLSGYQKLIITMIFCYIGIMYVYMGRDEIHLIIPYVRFSKQSESRRFVIVDTSVIIDGRIADILQTDFIDEVLVIPRFVLKELHSIADSSDDLRRQRGRRGLEILKKIQESSKAEIKIDDSDFPDITEVDHKLIRLAKIMDAKILTNDYNLNKVAEIEKVKVLNINDLANVVKAVVLPAEKMKITIVRAGKEKNQGVGYLDDGTMIVVSEGRRHVGKKIDVEVVSVLQTSAGKMIFADIRQNKRHHQKWENAKL